MVNTAKRVEDIYKYTSPEPLRGAEFADWYRDLSSVRGESFIRRLELGLRRAHGARPMQAFVMGHSGSGKSTELTRLCQIVQRQFQALRLNASAELDPNAFEPFDVLLITLQEVITRTALPLEQGGAATQINATHLRRVQEWLSLVEVVRTTDQSAAVGAEVGGGATKDGLLASVLGMFASVRGEAKYAASRKKEVREHGLSRLSDLIALANDILQEANAALRQARDQEWLIIWEDFDKPIFKDEKVQELFLQYGHVWTNLRCNLIVTIPIGLGYSEGAARLPLPQERRYVVSDPSVYNRRHEADRAGRAALLDLLGARVSLGLFEPGQAEALVVASGGNLRDLLALVNRAADTALVRDERAQAITAEDVDEARSWLRGQYLLRLGENPYEQSPVVVADKMKRLLALYKGTPEAQMSDRVLYALLRTHAVQEFNHERWLGIHPLVVDILEDQGHFPGGPPPGGTRASPA